VFSALGFITMVMCTMHAPAGVNMNLQQLTFDWAACGEAAGGFGAFGGLVVWACSPTDQQGDSEQIGRILLHGAAPLAAFALCLGFGCLALGSTYFYIIGITSIISMTVMTARLGVYRYREYQWSKRAKDLSPEAEPLKNDGILQQNPGNEMPEPNAPPQRLNGGILGQTLDIPDGEPEDLSPRPSAPPQQALAPPPEGCSKNDSESREGMRKNSSGKWVAAESDYEPKRRLLHELKSKIEAAR